MDRSSAKDSYVAFSFVPSGKKTSYLLQPWFRSHRCTTRKDAAIGFPAGVHNVSIIFVHMVDGQLAVHLDQH